MAGDWIKMRMNLQSHPKVVRILSATQSDKFRVIGGLHSVWCVFDSHSEDGVLPGYTPETMDHIIGWDGFSDAMISVGWLNFDPPETLTMPGFDSHNGASAKRRAEDSERKRRARENAKKYGQNADKCPDSTGQAEEKYRTREEKRREEKDSRDSGESSEPTAPTKCPVSEIIESYKRNAPSLVQPRLVPESVKKTISARWRESEKHQSIEFWDKFFAHCEATDFLAGRAEPSKPGQKPFRGSIEWVVNPSNFAKIINGNYS